MSTAGGPTLIPVSDTLDLTEEFWQIHAVAALVADEHGVGLALSLLDAVKDELVDHQKCDTQVNMPSI